MKSSPGYRQGYRKQQGILIWLVSVLSGTAYGDVVRDGSIGPGTGIQPTGPDFAITEAMGQLNGTNLFHSFNAFDLTSSQSATFSAVSPVSNVISRITSGSASSIDGAINSSISGANVFLINPSGMMFGPNAQINVDGSFHVTAADYLKLADNSQFNTSLVAPLTLSSAAPVAFGFLNAPPGNISFNQSHVTVADGATISVTGGALSIQDDGSFANFTDRTFYAANGLIHIESVASAGEVAVNNVAISGLQTPTSGSDIVINDSFMDVSGTAAGKVYLSGNNVAVNDSWLFSNNTGSVNGLGITVNAVAFTGSGSGGMQSSTSQLGAGGNIEINAGDITLRDGFGLLAASEALATGRAGDIKLNASNNIDIVSSTASYVALSTESRGAGDAGDINIDANNTTIDNADIVTTTLVNADGGDININTQQLLLQNRGRLLAINQGTGIGGDITINAASRIQVSGPVEAEIADIISSETFSAGAAGNITLVTPELLVDEAEIKASSKGAGNAGNMNVQADTIELINGGQISATTQFAGQGGSITINAGNSINMNGSDAEGNSSGIFTESRITSSGNAGHINITTPELNMTGEAAILTDTLGSGAGGNVTIATQTMQMFDDSEIASDVNGSGNGGSVVINTQTLSLVGDPEISADTNPLSTGNSGSVQVIASESMRFQIQTVPGEEAGIFTNSEGSGDAGDISVTTPLLDMNGGVLNARTEGDGAGGSVNLQVAQLFMKNAASISALSSGAGNAGNISIQNANVIQLLANSAITTESGLSNGGNIDIQSQTQLVVRDSRITANVNDGTGGNINVASDLVALDNSQLVAQAGAGQGGVITVSANKYFNGESLVSASAGPAGISGSVDINAPDIDLSSSMARLKTEFVDIASLINSVCSTRKQDTSGRFVVSKRRGLPSMIEGIPVTIQSTGKFKLEVTDQQPYANAAIIDLSTRARTAIGQKQFAEAIQLLKTAKSQLDHLADGTEKIYSQIHLARSHALIAENNETLKHDHLLEANNLLETLKQSGNVQNDARAASYVWGNQSLLYQQQHRHAEALYLVRKAQALAQQANAPEALYIWLWHEGQLLWSLGQTQASVLAYQRAVDVLDETRQDALVRHNDDEAFFHTQIAPVYRDLVDALLRGASLIHDPVQAETLLYRARSVLARFKVAELRNYFMDPCITEQEQHTVGLDQVDEHAAIIYPVILDDRIELLVSLKTGMHRFTVDVDSTKLRLNIRRFRLALQQTDSRSHLHYGSLLYQWLLQPYKNLLGEHQIKTLVFVMDGPLRTIPMAALYDGKNYLISHYALAVSVGLDMVEPKALNREHANVLMAGLSQSVEGYPALPYVPDELKNLQSLFGGEVLLDQAFLIDRLRSQLDTEKPSVVHLASHAKFSGQSESSFLLAYDGRITLDKMAEYIDTGNRNQHPLELLVLSACETAAGDDRAALGLAGMGIKAGARSAMGSLWSIPDAATYQLMKKFYTNLKDTRMTRAEALQSAQLSLLENETFAHPFNWSAFLMINNWL